MTFQHLTENLHERARPWNMRLGVEGFRYADLNRVRRLEALDRVFLASLAESHGALSRRFESWRAGAPLEKLEESQLIMEVAPFLAGFLARLFHIEAEHAALNERVRGDQVIFQWKKKVVEKILKDGPAAG